MSKGARIFLVITIVWLALWSMGGVLFFRGARSQDSHAEQVALPVTGLVRGADVRLDGIVDDQHPVIALVSQEKCAAALTHVSTVGWYYDGQQKRQRSFARVAVRMVPHSVVLFVGAERVELPLEHWQPPIAKSADVSKVVAELPAHLGISAAEAAAAAASGRGTFEGFVLDEWRLFGGERVFVIAHLQERDGRLQLTPHSQLQRVELHRGSQADAVEALRGSSAGLRIAGTIFIVLAVLPLVVFVIVRIRRRAP